MNNIKLAVIRGEYGGICGYDPREEPTYKSLPKYGINYEFVNPNTFVSFSVFLSELQKFDIVEVLEPQTSWNRHIIDNHDFVVCVVGDSYPPSLLETGTFYQLKHYQLKHKFRHYIARTSHIRQTLINLLVPHTKITMIPRAADIDKFYPDPKLRTINDFVVLYVGRIDISSGIQYLVPEFLKFAKDKDDVQLVVVGKSSASTGLDKYLKEKYPNPKIKWLGQVPHESLLSIYNNADVFAHLGFYPDNGNHAILEAMACGLPLIGLKIGSLEDRISMFDCPDSPGIASESQTGWVLNDYSNLSEVLSVYYHWHNNEQYNEEKLKKHCRTFAEAELGSNHIGRITAELYKDLLAHKDDVDEWSQWYQ